MVDSSAPEPAGFLALLPTVAGVARAHFRHVRCPDAREDRVAEAVALAFTWYRRLVARGTDPAAFPVTFARLAARAVHAGRRVCGQERAKDALSSSCQRRRGFAVARFGLPAGLPAGLEDAFLADPRARVADQAAFRVDYPRWRASIRRRDRAVLDALAAGGSTSEVAATFNVSPARVSQLRREFQESWHAFHRGDR